ncbi:hypothetical protein BBJ28_00026473, partial [Nothophytophthora sp. Chile5]
MMRFPLTHSPFPPLHLADDDRHSIVDLADLFVNQTLNDYESHLEHDHGYVNEARWKMVKRFEDVVVYQDRETLRTRRMTREDP